MAADKYIVVEGLDDVAKYFADAKKVVQGDALVKALSAGGEVFAEALQAATPVRKDEPGGELGSEGGGLDRGVLKENVTISVALDSQGRGGTATISHGKYSYVANWLEFGHRLLSHGIKSIRRVIGNVPPKPFVRPAAESAMDKATEVFTETLAEELDNGVVARKVA